MRSFRVSHEKRSHLVRIVLWYESPLKGTSSASDLLYWKSGLKVLRLAQLPKWRGSFKWQIEAKIEALQEAVARLRAEAAKPDG